jgi:glycine dehydrogenase subunit 1
MQYISITEKDEKEMLREIGASSIGDLFRDIPESIRLKELLDLQEPKSDLEVETILSEISLKNLKNVSFLGGGSYRHYIPAAVDQLSSRSEFYTAYTPYQPEVSQGTLSAIFEFQTMISSLTGMDASNAGMYDGATSLAESVIIASRANNRNKAAVSSCLNPNFLQVLRTYAWAAGIELVMIEETDGLTDQASALKIIDDSVSSVVIQNPNFFGSIEDLELLSKTAKDKKAAFIVCVTEPLSLALLKPPGSLGADIVCGEAQSFGNYPGFGGPLLGILAVKNEYLRRMPGRLVGKTLDESGREAYVLTLQTREQHIRREKATSNICSNEALVALRSVIYLSLLGPKLRDLAVINHNNASYLKKRLIEKGFIPAYKSERPYFNEFVVRHKDIKRILKETSGKGYIPGLYLGDFYKNYSDAMLVCATEFHSKDVIDKFIETI